MRVNALSISLALLGAALQSPLTAARPAAVLPVVQRATLPSHSLSLAASHTVAANAAKNAKMYTSILQARARNEYAREQTCKLYKIQRGNPNIKEIALTFDDGPHKVYTRKLVEVLNSLHVPATFFLVGKQVVKYPQLVQLEVMDGYEVGNHTYDHVNLTKIPPSRVGYELDACGLAIERATGSPVRFFRPPGGDVNAAVVHEATQHNYIVTLWTNDPGDYAKPGSDILLQRSLDKLQNGAIVLLHDGMPETMAVLPSLVAEGRRRGFTFVTLSELVQSK
jgi:peptidoglycan-N-acetylglucosamine deacetylase